MPSAGIISAVLGFLSAVTLGIPAWKELRERRQWDALQDIQQNISSGSSQRSAPGAAGQIDEIQWEFVRDRMGGYFAHRRAVLAGFVLLALSFGFDIVDNVQEARREALLESAKTPAIEGSAFP